MSPRRDFRVSPPNFVIADQDATPALMKKPIIAYELLWSGMSETMPFSNDFPIWFAIFSDSRFSAPSESEEREESDWPDGESSFFLGSVARFLGSLLLVGIDRFPPSELLQGSPLFLLLMAFLGGWFRMMGCILLMMGPGVRGGKPPVPSLLSSESCRFDPRQRISRPA